MMTGPDQYPQYNPGVKREALERRELSFFGSTRGPGNRE
jgi:hypothetical protein